MRDDVNPAVTVDVVRVIAILAIVLAPKFINVTQNENWTATGSKKVDLGRFDDTQEEADRYVFRVPMLRNIAKTGPYFHDGSVAQLAEAVQVMADVQLGNRLSEEDEANIVQFLKSFQPYGHLYFILTRW